MDRVDAKIDSRFDTLDAKIDATNQQLGARIDSTNARIDVTNEKLSVLDAQGHRSRQQADGGVLGHQ